MTPDTQDTIGIAVAQIAITFMGMRLLYGAWPWEFKKTWYATSRLLRQIIVEQDAQEPLDGPPAPVITLVEGADNDSFVRKPAEQDNDPDRSEGSRG